MASECDKPEKQIRHGTEDGKDAVKLDEKKQVENNTNTNVSSSGLVP